MIPLIISILRSVLMYMIGFKMGKIKIVAAKNNFIVSLWRKG